MGTRVTAVVSLAAAGMLLSGCATRPANKAEVCDAFDDLGTQLLEGNGVFGNPLFNKADDLADIADRYEGSPSLTGDAAALKEIADSEATSGAELMAATESIATLCGHPLSTNVLFGDGNGF
jgi:hypothetical protein